MDVIEIIVLRRMMILFVLKQVVFIEGQYEMGEVFRSVQVFRKLNEVFFDFYVFVGVFYCNIVLV